MLIINEKIVSGPSFAGAFKANGDALLTERETAALLGVTDRCLQAWRYRGGGPHFVKISARCVRYRLIDLENFIESRIRTSTSDTGEAGAT